MTKERENNFDLLRIISAIAIISLHTSALYFNTIMGGQSVDKMQKDVWVTCLYDGLARFAVPCFVMLSGAFNLANPKNSQYKYFYKKIFNNVGVHTIVFSTLYFVLFFVLGIIDVVKDQGTARLWKAVIELLSGEPYYHMWYLYMMIGVYLLTPVVILFKNDIGEKQFDRISIVFIIAASVSVWTSTYKVKWNLGLSFCYLGYYMIGYVIRKRGMKNDKNNVTGLFLVVIGIMIEIGVCRLQYLQLINQSYHYEVFDPYCPLIVISSVFVFMGISRIQLKKNLSAISSLTFVIYLVHAGVLWILGKILPWQWGCRIWIPVCIVIVGLISSVIAWMYLKVWQYQLWKKK